MRGPESHGTADNGVLDDACLQTLFKDIARAINSSLFQFSASSRMKPLMYIHRSLQHALLFVQQGAQPHDFHDDDLSL